MVWRAGLSLLIVDIPPNIVDELLPGDCLVYRPSGIFGWITAIKTWTRAAHVEAYFGRGWSVASRNGIGVNFFPFRNKGLARVLRPKQPFDMPQAMRWFHASAKGQKYDWLGLLCFTLAVRSGDALKMFCSEFLTRWYRSGGFQPFSIEQDADRVAPAQFVQSAEFTSVWSDKEPL